MTLNPLILRLCLQPEAGEPCLPPHSRVGLNEAAPPPRLQWVPFRVWDLGGEGFRVWDLLGIRA